MLYKKPQKSKTKRRRIIILCCFIMSVFIFLEFRLKPVASSIAEMQARSLATEIINQSVADIITENNITCEQLETIKFSPDNRITAVCSDTIVTNKLKNDITLRIQENISGIRSRRTDIPLGTITGYELFNGLGPSIPLFISLSGNVRSDFESTFESGGLNQTVHKLSVKISAEITVLMPLGSYSTNVDTSVLIGETVIVGETPSGMVINNKETFKH